MKKQKISFLLSYSSIFHLGAWRNSIQLWNKRGYQTELIQFKDANIDKDTLLLLQSSRIIEIPYPLFMSGGLYVIKYISRNILSRISKKLKSVGDGIAYIIKGFYYCLMTLFFLGRSPNQIIVAGDPPSLLAAYLFSRMSRCRVVYWSLELMIENELPDFGMKVFKKIEKSISRKILCGIEFGEKRADLLRLENGIPDRIRIFSIPNSRMGEGNERRGFYFNDLFNIPRQTNILLYAGGIFSEVYKIAEIFEILEAIPENYVFIIHSNTDENIVNKLRIPASISRSHKFFYNKKPVPYEDIDLIYSSADIGLILQGPSGQNHDTNLYYSDLSIGKLFNYAYNGKPVISRELFGYKKLIEGNGIGFCFNDMKEIPDLVKKIQARKDEIIKNCHLFNKKYEFEKNHEAALRYISSFPLDRPSGRKRFSE